MLRDSVIVKSRQAWKLAALMVVLLISGVLMVLGLRGGRQAGSMEMVLGSALFGLFALVLTSFSVRCRVCRMHWLWEAIRHREHSGWVTWLLALRACPQCGDDGMRKP
jgi:hypothetical protein